MLNIDDYWLNDRKLAHFSRQVPSTDWSKELMTDAWPKMFQQLCSSETYRGYAIVLSILCAHMRKGISIGEVEQIIESVDRSVKTMKKSWARLGTIIYGFVAIAFSIWIAFAAATGFSEVSSSNRLNQADKTIISGFTNEVTISALLNLGYRALAILSLSCW